MPRKRVTIHYRRLQRGSAPPFPESLAQKVAEALRSTVNGTPLLDDVGLRLFADPDGTSLLLNGRRLTPNGDVFGEMLRYNPDTNIPLVFRAAGPVAELAIGEATRPNGADFLKGMLFFLLRGDHVFLIQQDLSAGVIERYLRWLTFTCAKVADRDARIQLLPQALLDGDADLFERVSKITLAPPPEISNILSTGSGAMRLIAESTGTNIREVLRAAHLNTPVLERLEAVEGMAVKLTITLEFKDGRKKRAITGDDAVALLRDVPEEELIVVGEGAKRNRGAVERLALYRDVEQIGNVLDKNSAFAELNDAAAEYRRKGLIT